MNNPGQSERERLLADRLMRFCEHSPRAATLHKSRSQTSCPALGSKTRRPPTETPKSRLGSAQFSGVGAKIGASRSHVWNLAKYDPDFPQPIRLSQGVTVWDEREVDTWIEGKRRNGESI